jgi:Tol biopolymer transport system component
MTTRQTFYLPVMIEVAVLLVCVAALLAGSQKAEATFRGQNGKIAYASDDGQDDEIYTINAGGGDKFQVTNNDKNNLSPSYSPSGAKLAYVGINRGDWDIYTTKVGGGGTTQVTDNNKYDFAPSYSPSGKKLAYECYAGIDTDICTVSVRGGGKFNVTKNDTDDFNPDYSPDGNRIAYEGFEGRIGENPSDDASTNIYTIKVGGGGKFNITKSSKIGSIRNQWPSYSPDGNRIAYQGPDHEIHTIKVGGGGKSRVTNNDTPDYGISWGTRYDDNEDADNNDDY